MNSATKRMVEVFDILRPHLRNVADSNISQIQWVALMERYGVSRDLIWRQWKCTPEMDGFGEDGYEAFLHTYKAMVGVFGEAPSWGEDEEEVKLKKDLEAEHGPIA